MLLRFKSKKTHMMIRSRSLVAAASILLLALGTAPLTQAGTYSLLYSFNGGNDGQWPVGGLVKGIDGNYYGTTQGGGTANGGTIFKITPAGVHTVLHSFSGADGNFPSSTLTIDLHGVIYGTTYAGGASGLGTVFKLSPQPCAVCSSALGSWKLTTLYSFSGTPDGKFPVAGLVVDASGNLYGTTGYGGAYNNGAVFKLTGQGEETIVYSFTGANDGANPLGPLTLDAEGNLYGTTTAGGTDGMGTIFMITPAGTESVLHSFAGASSGDGAYPFYSSLTRDSSGNMFGTTLIGGNSGAGAYGDGFGVVFKLTSAGTESIIYNFCNQSLCADGDYPTGGVIQGSSGLFYGTTSGGYYEGVLFSMSSQGGWGGLHQFWNLGGDGFTPLAILVQDPSGTMYGTTYLGGTSSSNHAPYWGTVFKYTP